MTPLQEKLLELMKWFHLFCEKNQLRYYMLCGTMLGAARHEGFIPWDDDIDVGLPRKDYNKLAKLMSSENCEPYLLETPYSEAQEYCFPYSKIYDTRTTLIENKRKKLIRGVFIDVFPIDGLGESEDECKANFKPINKKYNFLLSRVCGIRKGRSWYKNLAVLLTGALPSFIVDNKKIMTDLDKMCASIDYDNSSWICNDFGAWKLKEAVPKSVMGEPVLYKFEDTYVYGVSDYETYLTRLYGDWRKLPPKEKQITHHDFISLDLNHSYLDNFTKQSK